MVTIQTVLIQIVTTVFLWLTIILYHWNSRPFLHTIKLVYRNNHHLYKHMLN